MHRRSSTGAAKTWRRTNVRGLSNSSTLCPNRAPAKSCGANCRPAKTPPPGSGRRREGTRLNESILPMKALLSTHAGGPETLKLEDIAEPGAGPGQVRIAVRACGVNFPDLLIIQDLYQYKPSRPFAPGAEVAGVVDAVGEGVDNVAPGDRVLLSPVRSGMAEKAVGPATNCWKIPESMPFDEAAALLMTY